MTANAVRTELKKIVSHIETLARETSALLDSGADILEVANELVKNSVTLTFGVGNLYGAESTVRTSTTAKVSKPRAKQSNFHNVRDNRGRFVRVLP